MQGFDICSVILLESAFRLRFGSFDNLFHFPFFVFPLPIPRHLLPFFWNFFFHSFAFFHILLVALATTDFTDSRTVLYLVSCHDCDGHGSVSFWFMGILPFLDSSICIILISLAFLIEISSEF